MKDYQIGDQVWTLMRYAKEDYLQCPDCFGKKFLTVILGDGSQVTIDCVTCAVGYNPPTGVVAFPYADWFAVPGSVTRKEQTEKGVEYGVDGSYHSPHIYNTQEEAVEAIMRLKEDEMVERAKGMQSKHDAKRSWAWNVTYHRREVKRHEKDIEYHKSKLEAAKQHTKEDK